MDRDWVKSGQQNGLAAKLHSAGSAEQQLLVHIATPHAMRGSKAPRRAASQHAFVNAACSSLFL